MAVIGSQAPRPNGLWLDGIFATSAAIPLHVSCHEWFTRSHCVIRCAERTERGSRNDRFRIRYTRYSCVFSIHDTAVYSSGNGHMMPLHGNRWPERRGSGLIYLAAAPGWFLELRWTVDAAGAVEGRLASRLALSSDISLCV